VVVKYTVTPVPLTAVSGGYARHGGKLRPQALFLDRVVSNNQRIPIKRRVIRNREGGKGADYHFAASKTAGNHGRASCGRGLWIPVDGQVIMGGAAFFELSKIEGASS